MFSIHFVKKDLHIRTNIDILVPKFQFKISHTICVIFCINPFDIFPPCCRIVTFVSTHIPHSKCTVWQWFDICIIVTSYIGDGQHSNRRTYLKFLEMTFLAMDFYLVKEKSIYNIFEIWVFSSILIKTLKYILKMLTTPWALLTSCSWINKILSDVISRLLWPWTFPECQISVGDFDPQTLIRNSLHVLRHAVLDSNHRHTKSL